MNQILLYLGDFAFRTCSSLSQIIFVNGLMAIGTQMFFMLDGNGNPVATVLRYVTIPSSITYIGCQYALLNVWTIILLSIR